MTSRRTRADEPAGAPANGKAAGTGSATLWRVASSLATAPDVSTTLQRVVEAASTVFAPAAAAVLLYDQEQDLFVPAVPSVAVGLDERWLQRQGLEGAQSVAREAMAARDVI